MVCKEEVLDWFKRMSGPRRIDLMCGLLHMCMPLELRFLGSYLEDLAKNDLYALRESELKANDAAVTRTLSNIIDEVTRSKLNIYLSLLYSTNTVCSNILYGIVTSNLGQIEHHLRTSSCAVGNHAHDRFAEDILLLLTMAANHPVFTFVQRKAFQDILQNIQKLLGEPFDKEPVVGRHSRNQSSNPLVEPVHNNSHNIVQRPGEFTPVFVKHIELKGSQWRDRRLEFSIQVTWSDGQITETNKTYQELYSFHTELVKLFPKDSGAHKLERHIPFLPQEKGNTLKGNTLSQKELNDHVSKYIGKLADLPEHMVQCEHMGGFFRPVLPYSCPSSVSSPHHPAAITRLPPPQILSPPIVLKGLDEEPVTASGHIKKTMTIYNSHILDSARKNADGMAPHIPGQPGMVPTATNVVTTPTTNHSSPLPTPLSSPYASPSANSCNRQTSPRASQMEYLAKWLKKIRLHKYTEQLKKYSIEELMYLNDHDLEAAGLTQGARKKLRNHIDTLRNGQGPNGIVISDVHGSPRSISPMSPSSTTWHTPPGQHTYLPPPHGGMGKPVFPSNLSHTSSMDSSTECSEYSSPAQSPRPDDEHQAESSSDDNETTEVEGRLSRGQEEMAVHPGLLTLSAPHLVPGHPHPGEQPPLLPPTGMEQPNTFVPIQNTNVNGSSEVKSPVGELPVTFPVGLRPFLPGMDPLIRHGQQMWYMTAPAMGPRPQGKPMPVNTGIPNYPPKMAANPMSGAVVLDSNQMGKPSMGLPVQLHTVQSTGSVMTVSSVPITETATSIKPSTEYMPQVNTAPVRPSNIGPLDGAPMRNVPSSMPNVSGNNSTIPMSHMPVSIMPDAGSRNGTPVSSSEPANMSMYQSISTSQTSNTVTYSTPGYHSAATAVVAHQAPTPPHSACSSCGCSGRCGVSNTTPTTPHYGYMWPHPHMYPGLRFLPPTSNGMISHVTSHPYNHPMPAVNIPNGVNPELFYSNFVMQHHPSSQPVAVTFANNSSFLFPGILNSVDSTANGTPKPKSNANPMCCNCGNSGHWAKECKEPTMDTLSHSGIFHLRYSKQKQDSE